MRVLLVEDDPLIGEAVQLALKDASHGVDWVRDGDDALHAIGVEEYGVIVLDLGLPKKDGFEVLRKVRQDPDNNMPIIVATARDAIEDRIKGLDLGADDYLVKPFSIDELKARIRALSRRNSGSASALLTTSDLSLDINICEVSQNGQSHLLSAREFSLLQALMQRPGRVLSRSSLEEQIYGWNEGV